MKLLSLGRDSDVQVSINANTASYDVSCGFNQGLSLTGVSIFDAWLAVRQMQVDGNKVPAKFLIEFAELAIQSVNRRYPKSVLQESEDV